MDLSALIDQKGSRWQFVNVLESGKGFWNIFKSQIEIQSLRFESSFDVGMDENGLEFRTEDKSPLFVFDERVVERFYPHPVPSDQKPFSTVIPKGEGKHAPKFLETVLSPFLIAVDDGFGVCSGFKCVTACYELLPKLGEIVDLSVVSHPYRAILVG
jgi:hypothetical protein